MNAPVIQANKKQCHFWRCSYLKVLNWLLNLRGGNYLRNKPKVTIGICVRNNEKTIRKAIESVINQDFPHNLMEIIFVDDGSEDNTLSIIQDYASKIDIKTIVFHGAWKGLGQSRNTAVNNARGDYIIWVDGDIELTRNYVRKQVEFMEQHPKVGIAGGKFGFVHERNPIAALENIECVVIDYLYGNKARSKPVFTRTGASIYRVSAIKQVNGFDPNIKGSGEDTDVAYKIGEAGWLIYTANDAVFYHKGKGTLKDLWNQNAWYGYGQRFLKKKTITSKALIAGILYPFIAYKLMHQKKAFLLPLLYYFKKIAWCFGFIKSHIDKYGHP